ncbi:rho GTPase-activating protein 21-like isoform X3 [Myxocyprinus asiaticus]|uniref:rho GTPase-activating protein 21-like isoform X3 n=1 Tax=Myxocyprinus asiaticus TaxID=70543 RepID=UPI0022220865|nr:rho GTPase-activating protein 21-like isoform X3 [Myxocyprinus asiaticus]
MLTQRNGACAHCVLPSKDCSDQVEVEDCTCAIGNCSWDCLTGVDGCLSDKSCLWFQLLARAYWGDVELGLREAHKGVSWHRPRKMSQRNYMRSLAKKDGCERSEASALSPAAEEEPFSWPGPKTLHLRRTSHGFGFTLRHFIVYPPESAVQSSFKDEDNSSRGRQRNRLEPMDTIFVKQVKEGGPAHGAGLCTGDRIVKVNGESIIGKTYSQVIALIQNSDTSLELCVMPKDEDILQLFSRDITALAYSQDAYLKANEAYSGNAQNIPEPPSICYPRIEPNAMVKVLEPSHSAEVSCRTGQGENQCSKPDKVMDIPISAPTPPQTSQVPKTQTVVCVFNESVRTMVASTESTDRTSHMARAGPSHRMEENRYAVSTEPGFNRFRTHATSSPTGAAQLHIPNITAESTGFSSSTPRTTETCVDTTPTASQRHTLTTTAETFPSATSPTPYTPSPPPATPSPCSPHQNIDWRNYTTYKEYIDNKRLYMYGCRTIQERLDSLRATTPSSTGEYSKLKSTSTTATPSRGFSGSQLRQRSASHDRSYLGSSVLPLRSASQERLGGAERTALARNWPRSASQDALPLAPTGIPKPRACSCDYLGRQNDGAGSILDRQGCCRTETEERILIHRGDEARASRQSSLRMVPQPHRTQEVFSPDMRGGSYPGLPLTPLFCRGTGSLLTSRAESLGNTAAPSLNRPSLLPAKNYVSDSYTVAGSYVASALASIQGHISGSSNTGSIKDQRTPLIANHLPHNAEQPRGRADSLQEPVREVAHGCRSSSCSAVSKPHRTKQGGTKPILTSNGTVPKQPQLTEPQPQAIEKEVEGIEGPDATVVVVRREKSGSQPIRHPSYILAVNDTEPIANSNKCWLPNDAWREMHKRKLGDQCKTSISSNLNDSLDSIPFIDEPSSSSNEHDATHIPASAVISSMPVITTIPPSPTSPTPVIRRQLSHDQDSLRLTVLESDSGAKTERSKSFDEGLDNYREEGRGSIKHTHGFKGLRKAVDKSSEDSGSGSRKDSTSDVFTDATKEGPLHFKQLNIDKGKRVGSGMRPWKQIYAVLRGHCLYLYKDKKDNSQTEDEPLPISIKACLIDISYSDTKRKNVLRLTTSDCEYLFQAEDREEMLSWIRVIQENSNLDEENATVTSTDLINRKIKEYNTLMSPTSSKTEPSPKASRQSLSIRQTLMGSKGENKASSPHSLNKDHDRKAIHKDETSPPKDKGTWRKGIPGLMRKPFEKKPSQGVTFGVKLDDCPPAQTNRFVPLIVEVCCNLVEERGLEYTGIYRVPGNNSAISIMQEELNNKGMGDIDIQDDKWKDLNVISSLLKSFFRKLPEPLFTNERYGDFIDANRIEDPVERLKVLKRLLHELPDHHYETLKFLSAHLKTVAENSEKNKMEPRNLAIVFGPTLVRTSEDNMTHMVTHMPDQYKIVETLIQHYDWFFTEEGNNEPTTTVQEESVVESQPVPNIDHLLTNIGRTGTSPGEVSDSPTSDSAKSKQGSWGSGKDQCSRDFLQPRVSSIFAAANRKRKKHKEKLQPSSSDDDLDAVFTKKENPTQKQNHQSQEEVAGRSSPCEISPAVQKKNSIGAESTPKIKEHRNSFFMKTSPKLSCSPVLNRPPKSSLSDPSSQLDETTSDLGTMSSGASVPRTRPRKWGTASSPAPELLPPPGGASVTAEVSSITSDYSTTSSTTFLMGVESITLSPEVQSVTASRGGDEADDERSELISEGRPMETDSESDFPMFSPANVSRDIPTTTSTTADNGSTTPKLDSHHLLPSHKLMDCDTLSSRRSLRPKTDSDSSVEAGAGGMNQGISKNKSNRLSRVLEVMKRGRSTSSLSASFRTESDRVEPAWHLKLTERLKFRLRSSADDMLGVGTQKSRSTETCGKKKGIRRRHTMGGQRDFAELDVIHDWREQGGVDQGAELPAVECLRPKCNSQDLSIREWIAREHRQAGGSQASLEPESQVGPEAAETGETQEGNVEWLTSSASSCTQSSSEQVNGGASKDKSRNSPNPGADAHPQKLSGAQVVRSRFYQYL